MMRNNTFLKSAFVLSLGGLVAKVIGALYRIPLTGLLGGYGTGLYQMAYPLFCVLLTFSSAGIPSAFSRVIARERAQGEENGQTVKAALRLFALLGVAGAALMCLFAPVMGMLQGDANLLRCYIYLAPSVFLVALIAVLRGYFQGKSDMAPTAVSEIIEQIFKAAAGLFFAYRYRNAPEIAAAYTLLAVTISELFALGYLVVRYRREYHVRRLRARPPKGKHILFSALPVMAAASLLPLSQTVDSIVIVRLLSGYTARAVSLYGLFSGGAIALVSLPATVCYGFAAATVPAVSSAMARGDEQGAVKRAFFALTLTLALAVPCAMGLFFLAKPIVALLYSSLSAEDTALLIRLVRLSSVSAVTLAGVDTLAACLTGMGRAKRAAVAMLIAVAVKFALQFALVSVPEIGIAGAAIASNICYLIAFFLDFMYTVKKKNRGTAYDHDCELGNQGKRLNDQGPSGTERSRRSARAHRLASRG